MLAERRHFLVVRGYAVAHAKRIILPPDIGGHRVEPKPDLEALDNKPVAWFHPARRRRSVFVANVDSCKEELRDE